MKIIEIIFLVFFISISYISISKTYMKNINYTLSNNVKSDIINIVDYVSTRAKYDKTEYNIYFDLDNKYIEYLGKRINLNDNFIYKSRNKSNKFIRKINNFGNLDKGFSIIIEYKEEKLADINFSNNNGLKEILVNEKA